MPRTRLPRRIRFDEIARRHGAARANDVVHCGAEDADFFAQVEDLLGVEEEGFHDLIAELIAGDRR